MISYTLGAFYTGETADFNLDDVRCARALDEFAAWDWTGAWKEGLACADVYTTLRTYVFKEILALADKESGATGKRLAETLTAWDAPLLSFFLRRAEGVTAADAKSAAAMHVFADAVQAAGELTKKEAATLLETLSLADKETAECAALWADALLAEDARSAAFRKTLLDAMKAADKESGATGKRLAETLTAWDKKAAGYAALLTDALALTGALKSGMAKPFSGRVSFADGESNAAGKNVTETLGLADAFVRALGYLFSEAVLAGGGWAAHAKPHWKDGAKAAATLTRAVKAVLPDRLSAADALAGRLSFFLADGAGVGDARNAKIAALYKDAAKFSGKSTRESVAAFTEAVKAEDGWIGGYALKAAEALAAKDAYNAAFRKTLTDAAKLAGKLESGTAKILAEEVDALDAFHRVSRWARLYEESLKLSEAIVKEASPVFTDGLAAWGILKRATGKFLADAAFAEEVFSHAAEFSRGFAETAAVGEAEYQAYLAAYAETCAMLDGYIHGMDGVLSDVIAEIGAATLEEFTDAVSAPSGYPPFVDFRVGDYEYKEALYRFQITKKEASVLPALTGLIVHVDIPDTNDRGSATLAAEATKIHYNKSYYHAPEVSATVVGGTGSGLIIPYILTTDGEDSQGRYFEVVLKDISNNIVAGSIMWTAKGY